MQGHRVPQGDNPLSKFESAEEAAVARALPIPPAILVNRNQAPVRVAC